MPSARWRVEHRDIDGRAIRLFGIGLVAFLALAIVVLRLIFGALPGPVPFGFATGLADSSAPVLETDPRRDRETYDAEKAAMLHGLGWQDRAAGIAHIPIEDAMRIVTEEGVPDWGQHAASAGDQCHLLLDNVPRAPQAADCVQQKAGSP
jgi:hypothetical protein